jgi:hypothetical protein
MAFDGRLISNIGVLAAIIEGVGENLPMEREHHTEC